MHTCCILHNIILQYDKLDISEWEDVDWSTVGNKWDAYIFEEREQLPPETSAEMQADENRLRDFQLQNDGGISTQTVDLRPRDHDKLLQLLKRHFLWQFGSGRICWPKAMSRTQRALTGMLTASPANPRAIIRPNNSSNNGVLYISDSVHRLVNGNQSIGEGLYTRVDLHRGEFICRYIGEEITRAQRDNREPQGAGGYCLGIWEQPDMFLDCFDQIYSYQNDI